MTGCDVVRAEKRMFLLKKNRKPKIHVTRDAVMGLDADQLEMPDMAVTKRRIRVAEVQAPAGVRGKQGHFYNPVYAITQAIQDALDPEKVLAATPNPFIMFQANGSCGVKVSVVRRLFSEEQKSWNKARCYLLPNGRKFWVPPQVIDEEGAGFVRVWGTWLRRKVGIIKASSKYGAGVKALNPDAVKYRLMQLRTKKGKT